MRPRCRLNWPLSMKYKDDYAAAGVPMLAVVRGRAQVGLQVILYAWATVACSLLLIPVAVLNGDRGVSSMFLLFVGLVVATDFMIRRTRWGRSPIRNDVRRPNSIRRRAASVPGGRRR